MDMTNILPILRQRIGLPPDDTSKDDELTTAWDGSIIMAETYCDRKFDYKADAEEIFTYEADKTISLERYPLQAINFVTTADGQSQPTPFRFERKTGILHAYGFAHDEELTVNYAGGYVTLPADLMNAFLYIFDAVWANVTTSGGGGVSTPTGGIKAMSVPDVGRVEFESSGSSGGGSTEAWGIVPASATSILWFYRREFV